jgi:hypothetical protein
MVMQESGYKYLGSLNVINCPSLRDGPLQSRPLTDLLSLAMENMKESLSEHFDLFKRQNALPTPIAVPALADLLTRVRIILL